MIALYPVWLLLLIPLGMALLIWEAPTRLLSLLRLGTMTLVVIAMAGVSLKLKSRYGTVVVVVDKSHSMPTDSSQKQKEIVDLLQSKMGDNDRLAVVSFGRTASIERTPQRGKFSGFSATVNRDLSNLKDGIKLGISLIPSGTPGRILVLSDGKWTGEDPSGLASEASIRSVSIDYQWLSRPFRRDLAIAKIHTPGSVAPGEAFFINADILVPRVQKIRYVLRRGQKILAKGTQTVGAGKHRLTFRDFAQQAGTHRYVLEVKGSEKDSVIENNRAEALVGIRGQKPLLLVSETPGEGFYRLLKSSRVPVVLKKPIPQLFTLANLSRFSGMVIENISAQKIGDRGMRTIAAWVKQSGAGLMMTGGSSSFALGGYFKSPLASILPVSMELRREHRKLAMSLAVVLDRSCSMGMVVPGGLQKMDLANEATVESLRLLGNFDEFGVIAVDTKAHTIVPKMNVTQKAAMKQRILSITSSGGGIYVYNGLVAAYEMLQSSQSKTRHVILFADAQDAEKPGKYKALLKLFEKEKITVSVIGLGKVTDSDAALLQDIAKRGNGRIFFTEDASSLPRLFAQDTFVVARSTLIKQNTLIEWTTGLVGLTGTAFGSKPTVGGYNMSYLRPKATLAAVTVDEYKAPFVAYWQVGLGRVVAYTGEVDGKFTGPIQRWSKHRQMLSSLARWIVGDARKLPRQMLLTQKFRRGSLLVQMHLDPERKKTILNTSPTILSVMSSSEKNPSLQKSKMRWISPHLLQVEVPLKGGETSLSTVKVPGYKPVVLPPVVLPYSPEYQSHSPKQSRSSLERLAQATLGKERLDVTQIWEDLPRKNRLIDIRPWLLCLAILLFLCEVFERRSGYLSRFFRALGLPDGRKRSSLEQADVDEGLSSNSTGKGKEPRSLPRSAPVSLDAGGAQGDVALQGNQESAKEEATDGLSSAFAKASKRIKERRRED